MIKMYNTDINTNITEETKDLKKGNWINMISPTEEEIQRVCAALQIKQDFIRYSLDEEEKARIDTEDDDNTTLYIIDIPVIESDRTRRVYVTMPIGVIFVRDDYIITVSQKNNDIIKDIKTENVITYKKSRFLLQILYANSKKFLSLLYKINKELESTENKLKNSLQNEGLLKMLDLEKSLVYFTTSLKSNEVVMEKTTRGKIIKLYEEDEDLLENINICNIYTCHTNINSKYMGNECRTSISKRTTRIFNNYSFFYNNVHSCNNMVKTKAYAKLKDTHIQCVF